MASVEELKQLYTEYFAEYEKVLKKASPAAGLLGIGKGPEDDPCHEVFYDKVGEWVGNFMSGAPSSEEIGEAAEWILKAALPKEDDPAVFWILFAAHGHTAPLIPLMDPEARKELCTWYDKYHPKHTRLPVQANIGKLLKKKR